MARGAKKEIALTPEEKMAQALVPETEQPYRLPENWRWVYLSAICEIRSGNTLPEQAEKPEGAMLYIKVADMNLPGNEKQITYSSRYVDEYNVSNLIPANSVLFPKRGGAILTNKKRITEVPLLADLNIMALTPQISVNTVYYWFLTVDLGTLNNGSNVPQINNKDIAPLPFPLPPFAEQQRIVDRIEGLFAKLDEAKEKAQAVVDGFEDRKAAILHKAFTGELTAGWRLENGVSLDSWSDRHFKDILDVRDGTHDSPQYYNEGYPLVTSKNLKDGKITDKDIKFISEADYIKINERSKVNIGDILFAMIGTIGNPVVVEDEPNYAIKNMALFKNVGKVHPYFIKFYLESRPARDKMEKEARGSTQRFVSLGYLREFQVTLPTNDEQEIIVEKLNHFVRMEQQAKAAAEQVISQIDTMKKAILARAFRGELGTNDPTEESAERLLKMSFLS